MKKSIVTTVMAFGMALLCCACGSTGTAEQPDNSAQAEVQEQAETAQTDAEVQDQVDSSSILMEIASANNFNTLVEKYGKAAGRTAYIFKDGTEFSEYYYKDADLYVYESGSYVYIDENGDVYGFDDAINLPYRTIFVGDNYSEEYSSLVEVVELFGYSDHEEITSQKTENGVIVIETAVQKDSDTWLYEFLGYTADEVDHYKYVYEADENTKELSGYKEYIVKNEQEILVFAVTFITDCETYVPDEQLRASIFGDDFRTLTVITDPGTENEKTYTQTVTKGSVFKIAASEEYDPQFYSDKECTQVFTDGNLDTSADQTVYMKKAE
ncbi:MAG: hypothetical protein ACI4J6_03685 [Oscillospiraceae bacterium]